MTNSAAWPSLQLVVDKPNIPRIPRDDLSIRILPPSEAKFYRPQIDRMLSGHLEVRTGYTFFGAFHNGVLVGISTLKCYHGHWFLRACYVTPKFRGQGIQLRLIKARLHYLAYHTSAVEAKVRVDPSNSFSLSNIIRAGFLKTAIRYRLGGVDYSTYRLCIPRCDKCGELATHAVQDVRVIWRVQGVDLNNKATWYLDRRPKGTMRVRCNKHSTVWREYEGGKVVMTGAPPMRPSGPLIQACL